MPKAKPLHLLTSHMVQTRYKRWQHFEDPRPDIQFHMFAASLATDRGMVMKGMMGFKPNDPIDPWWQPHVGKDTFTLAPTLLRYEVSW